MTTAPSYPPPASQPSFEPAPPPPGPGVQPPFPAPPVEGRGKRIGLGLGIGAGILALICGGGAAAVFGLGASVTKARDEQAHVVVGQYLTALKNQKYDAAYGMLCKQARDDETNTEYRSRITAMEPIASYHLGDLNYVNSTMPVEATYTNGDTAQLEAYLGENASTGAFEVCDLGE